MHFFQGRFLRGLLGAFGVAAILAAGCGTPARPAGEGGRPIVSPTTSATSLPTASPPGGHRTPRYADPLDRYAYGEAYGRCAALGAAEIAEAYGASAADPASAASAYAEHSYPGTTRFRTAATRGCLDGLADRSS
jgi:hypothetical protein